MTGSEPSSRRRQGSPDRDTERETRGVGMQRFRAHGQPVRAALGATPVRLMFPPVVSVLAMGFALVVSVFKPRGKVHKFAAVRERVGTQQEERKVHPAGNVNLVGDRLGRA
jgi:hypothetical protein